MDLKLVVKKDSIRPQVALGRPSYTNVYLSISMVPRTRSMLQASGSIGNTVSTDLVNLLGSRMLAVLRDSGAPLVTSGGYDAAGS